MVLMASACVGTAGSDTATVPGVTSTPPAETTSTSPPPTTAPPVTDTTAAPTEESTTTTVAPLSGETPLPGTVIVAADTGVWVNAYQGGSTQLITWSTPIEFEEDAIDFAIDDTRGGFIVQPDRGSYSYTGADAIAYWIPKGEAALRSVLVPAEDQGLVIEDVVAQGETVGIYYTRTEGSLPEDASQTLRRFDLDTKAVEEIVQTGGWESGSNDISIGGDLILANGAGEAFLWVNLYDLSGNLTSSPANPLPDGEFDCYPTCGWGAALNPDGTQLVYPTVADGVTTFTIANVADGSIAMTFTLPSQGAWQVESLDLGADFLVVNRVEEGSVWNSPAWVVDLASGGLEWWEVPHNGVARLVRTVPEISALIEYP
jgi:hypothetical protein